jgi:alpha-L-rhamnosidase
VTEYVSSLIDSRTGLVTYRAEDGRDLVDWPPAMRYGYDVSTVARTTTNVLAALDFQRLAQIATLLGRRADATAAQARRDELVAAINTKLTRPDGVYVDGLLADGTSSAHAAQQASAFALATGIVPPEKVERVGAYVASLGIKTGPLNGLFLLEALRAAGRTADVVRILTDTEHPGWAYETAHGGTFTWESWMPDDLEGDSMSHGWGSSALVAFQTALLGVSTRPMGATPSGPVVNVTAPGAGPTRVAGQVPTIAGAVKVSWQRAGGRLTLDLLVPANTTAHVRVGGKERTVGAGWHKFTSEASPTSGSSPA